MAARREVTKKFARAYGRAGKAEKGEILDALIVLQEVWRLTGQPSGKYLAAVMDDALERLVRFRELGRVQPRVTDTVLDEVRAMSPATIDRYLKRGHTRTPPTRAALVVR